MPKNPADNRKLENGRDPKGRGFWRWGKAAARGEGAASKRSCLKTAPVDPPSFLHLKAMLTVGLMFTLGAGATVWYMLAADVTNRVDQMNNQAISETSVHWISFNLSGGNPFVAGEKIAVRFPSGFSLGGSWTAADFTFADSFSRTVVDVDAGAGVTTVDACTAGSNNVGVAVDTTARAFYVIACPTYTSSVGGAMISLTVDGEAPNGTVTNPPAAGSYAFGIIDAAGDCTAPSDDCSFAVAVVSDSSVAVTATVPSSAVCGNGTLESGEQCDDGNTTSGDGCSATCTTEGGGGGGTSAPTISNMNVTGITTYQVTVSWNTDVAADSLLRYGTAPTYGQQQSASSLVVNHGLGLTGLAEGTLYYFQACSANASNQQTCTAAQTFTTLDETPPVISNVQVTGITGTSATVTWTTDENATTFVDWDTDGAPYSSVNGAATPLTTSHSVTLTGLSAGTVYHYRVRSADASDNTRFTDDAIFTTTSTTPPVISNVQVTGITVSGATVTWTTDKAATTFVDYGTVAGPPYASTAGAATPLTTSHSVTLTGLSAGTVYHYRVRSADASGNSAAMTNATFETRETAPPVITSVAATNLTPTSARITWTTDENADSTVQYGLTVGYGSTLTSAALLTAHAIDVAGLTPNTTYNYRVKSKDKWGNEAVSGNYTFTTPLPPAPVISSVRTTNITESSARVLWDTNEASDSRLEFGKTTAYGTTLTNAALVINHLLVPSGLDQGTTYNYRVISKDAYNRTATSGNLTFTTAADTAAPGNPTAFTAAPGDRAVNLSWANPGDPDFFGVRLVRGTTGFPADSAAGTVVYEGTGRAFADTGVSNGIQYYYVLFARDEVPNWSSGAVASATPVGPLDTAPPGPVTGFTATPSDGTVSLSWINPADADFQATLIVRKSLSCPTSRTDGTVVYEGTDEARLDTGLTNGTLYCYLSFSHDGIPNYAAFAEASATPVAPPDTVPPGSVANLDVTVGDGQMLLTWNNPPDADWAGTRVVRKLTGFPAGPTDGTVVFDGVGDNRLDIGLTNGVTYFYSAFAYDGAGNYAAPATRSGTPVKNSPPIPGPACTDSDGGLNYDVKGIASESDGKTETDSCSDGQVKEYYCDVDGKIKHDVHGCGDGYKCSDGRCVPDAYVPTPTACGNGLCEGYENTVNCPADCPVTPAAPPVETTPSTTEEGKRLRLEDLRFVATSADYDLRVRYAYGTASAASASPVSRLWSPSSVLAADATDGEIQTYNRMSFTVILPRERWAKEPESGYVNLGGASYAMQTSARGLEAVVVTPPSPGRYPIEAIVNYPDGTHDYLRLAVKTVAKPTVSGEVKDDSDQPLAGARISLFVGVGGSYGLFDGAASGQTNPQLTDENGRYSFVVPAGSYFVRADKEGYVGKQTMAFPINLENVITTDVSLRRPPPTAREAVSAMTGGDVGRAAGIVAEQAGYIAEVTAEKVAEAAANPVVQQQARNVVAPTMTAIAVVNVVSVATTLPYLNLVFSLLAHPLLLIARRKRRRWGVVYNALTKLPIDLAIVRLVDMKTGRIIRSAVTDKDGRYFFIVGAGEYKLVAVKPGYVFPTSYLGGEKEDAQFIDLYHGDVVRVTEETSVTANIPLDPAKAERKPWSISLGGAGRRLQKGLGLVTVLIMAVVFAISPSLTMGVLLAVNIVFYAIFSRLAIPPRPKNWGVVYDEATKRPLSNVVVRIFETKFNKLLEAQVTDIRGRYAFLVGSNVYYVTYEKPGYQKQQQGPVDYQKAEIKDKNKEAQVVAVDVKLRPEEKKGAKPSEPAKPSADEVKINVPPAGILQPGTKESGGSGAVTPPLLADKTDIVPSSAPPGIGSTPAKPPAPISEPVGLIGSPPVSAQPSAKNEPFSPADVEK
jgi:cysteine-rich repeat protein